MLPELLTRVEVAEMRDALAPYLQGELMGRNDFEGFRSERVYALLAKDPRLALLAVHPRLLAIVDRLLAPHYLLSAFLAIHVHPGETAQGWHFDDGGCRVPRPRPMHGVSAIWALDDFGEDLRYSVTPFFGVETPIGPIYVAYGYGGDGRHRGYLFLGQTF